MTRLLIVGGSGFVGSNLVRYFGRRYDVRFSYFTSSDPAVTSSPAAVRLDVRDAQRVRSTLGSLAPEVVILAAGQKDVKHCERHPSEAFAINGGGTQNVARACRELGAFLLYLSTDLVFAGETGGYQEHDVPAPTSVYGRSKLEGERLAAAEDPTAAICRSGGVYGRSSPLLRWVRDALATGTSLDAFTDVFNTPTFAINLAEMLEAVMARRQGGIFHTVGSERVNRYQFFSAFAASSGASHELLRPAAAAGRHRELLLCPDVSLASVATAARLGVAFNTVEHGLARLRQEGGVQ